VIRRRKRTPKRERDILCIDVSKLLLKMI